MSQPTDTAATSAEPMETFEPSVGFFAHCTPDATNVLRAWCRVEVRPARAVEVELVSADGSERRTFTSAAAERHDIGVYGLIAETRWTWTVHVPDDDDLSRTGELDTGTLPFADALFYDVEGTPSSDLLLHILRGCGGHQMAVVLRPDGQVVWYEPTTFDRPINLRPTDADTVLVTAPTGIEEIDWMGRRVFTVTRGVDFDEPIHHDSYRDGDLVYVLFWERVTVDENRLRLDGFLVFDREGDEVARWRLAEHWSPEGPGTRHGLDLVHANAISVVDGMAIVSMRHQSTVTAVRADPARADFGEVVWRIAGSAEWATWGYDILVDEVDGAPAFEEQHDAALMADGRLSLFDNRIGSEPSRGLVVDFDLGAGTASVSRIYPLDRHCDWQGGHQRNSAGNPVLACNPHGLIVEQTEDGAAEVGRFQATCAIGPTPVTPRMVPVPADAW